MNLKEKFIEKRDEAIEWAKENKSKVFTIAVATVAGAVVVKNIVDNKKVIDSQTVVDTAEPEPVLIDDGERWSVDMWQFKERDEDKIVDFCKDNSISFNTSYRSSGYSYNEIEYDADGNRIGSTGSKSEPNLFD
jgi:hypothetical protein